MLSLFALALVPQQPAAPWPEIRVDLDPVRPSAAHGLQWRPEASTIALHRDGDDYVGSFRLGPVEAPPIPVRLHKSTGSDHFDILCLDRDRDGVLGEFEMLGTKPRQRKGATWSRFETSVAIADPRQESADTCMRPYPLSMWFVVDANEPAAAPALHWVRRGWHGGECKIDGKRAFVVVADNAMDGMVDAHDAWCVASDEGTARSAAARPLDTHCWLGGNAYRAVSIDPHGAFVVLQRTDPGITEREERAIADSAVDRFDHEAPRAARAIEFGTDLDQALADAKSTGMMVWVTFHADWNGPCAHMQKWVHTAAAVVEAADQVIPVMLDHEEHAALIERYRVETYPTLLLLDGNGIEHKRAIGYHGVQAIVGFVRD
ncbi:MAG: thioredoxin family protein [Planctomycetota bacterium]